MDIGEQFGNWVITKEAHPGHAVSIGLAGKRSSMPPNAEHPAGNHVKNTKPAQKLTLGDND
jgi:hypothetical protein